MPILEIGQEVSFGDYLVSLEANNHAIIRHKVTDMVEFFESFYKNKPAKNRKLHNIKNSVIILDEAQAIPLNYLEPCLTVLKELVNNYNCSVIFCTATQPSIYKRKHFNIGVDNIKELIDQPKYYFDNLKRVNVNYIGHTTNQELADNINASNKSTLIIVNTKKEAEQLCSKVNDAYYLTTNLCPKHRKERLAEIVSKLKNNEVCKVISTSLIEAGIDISFPVVYRALTGIDSIAQAAGRCNREGELSGLGQVYVYLPETGLPFGKQRSAAQITQGLIKQNYDLLSLEAVDRYFKQLYFEYAAKLDKRGIVKKLTFGVNDLEFPFKEVSKKFDLLEIPTVSVIVPYDKQAEKLINQLENFGPSKSLSRKLQQYAVQVKEKELAQLPVEQKPKGGPNVLTNMSSYREDVGLSLCEPLIV